MLVIGSARSYPPANAMLRNCWNCCLIRLTRLTPCLTGASALISLTSRKDSPLDADKHLFLSPSIQDGLASARELRIYRSHGYEKDLHLLRAPPIDHPKQF